MPKREGARNMVGDMVIEDVQALHMGGGDFMVRQRDEVTGKMQSVFLEQDVLRSIARMSHNILEMSPAD